MEKKAEALQYLPRPYRSVIHMMHDDYYDSKTLTCNFQLDPCWACTWVVVGAADKTSTMHVLSAHLVAASSILWGMSEWSKQVQTPQHLGPAPETSSIGGLDSHCQERRGNKITYKNAPLTRTPNTPQNCRFSENVRKHERGLCKK